MVLDAENPIPLYFQLKTIVESRISSGEFSPGDRIPSENQLCEEYGVSRTTARQAITELVNIGKLVRTQGRGTFVAHQPSSRLLYRLTGFSADMKKQGFNPSSKVLEFKVIIPTTDIAKILQVNPSEAVIYLKRLRYIDSQVMGLERTYLPFKRFPTLVRQDIEKGSLYETLIKKFETIPTRTLINFEAINCNEELCGLLETSPEIPILFISDLTYDQNDRLFEFSHTFYRGDFYSFHVEINKHQNDNVLFVQKFNPKVNIGKEE
jgi:GntR family transcriptional regulator